jgi:S-adenosylmethionine hydrolase
MSIITLTTDFGLKDHFVGALKGKIYSEFAEAKIVDISHDVDPFNISEASYIIGATYSSFPKGTVHIIGIDIELNTENQHIAIEWNNQFFIGADNGILSILTQKTKPEKIVEINIHDRFPTEATDIDVFVKVACHIAKGGKLNVIGKEINALKQITELQTTISEDGKTLKGIVNYIDHYGNAVTNISKKTFLEIQKGRSFEINFKNKNIKTIFAKYSDIGSSGNYPMTYYASSMLAVFNEAGFLEIAIFRSNPSSVGSANSLLGLNYRDVVSIVFSN